VPNPKSQKPYQGLKNLNAINSIASLYEVSSPDAIANGAVPIETNGHHLRVGVLLEDIQLRRSDTRPIDYFHALNLARSIVALGLLEPIVMDNKKRLLAGGHRREALFIVKQGSPGALEACLSKIQQWENEDDRFEAINLLKEGNPGAWNFHFPNDLVPVRMMNFDAEEDSDLALQVEIAENEQRKDYTRAEVKAIAQQLKDRGYIDRPGRPREGEKALRPTLNIIIGKSIRTIQRYLNESDNTVEVSSRKTMTSVVVSKEVASLQAALKALKKWQHLDKPITKHRKELIKLLPEVVELLELTLDEIALQANKQDIEG
jgi:ParB family chromosome partitioning protein